MRVHSQLEYAHIAAVAAVADVTHKTLEITRVITSGEDDLHVCVYA